MTIDDWMEQKFDKQVSQLDGKAKVIVMKIKEFIFGGYNLIKPILIAIFLFYLFNKIKTSVGIEEATFIQGVVVIIYLRLILKKLNKK